MATRFAPAALRKRQRALKVVGEVPAGRPFNAQVGPGEAARIFTGGFVPDGADAVVVQELTTRDGDWVEVQKPSATGRHVRRRGLDFNTGEKLFAKGHKFTARDLALVAGMNHPLVPVYRKPKVALFATGDERVPPGNEPGPGPIVYSNGFALAALIRQEGGDVIDLGVVGDKLDATIAAVRDARERGADILVTTGGASVGDYDFVNRALAAEGLALSFLEDRHVAAGVHSCTGGLDFHARARRARQSSVVLRLRFSVPGAADPQVHRPGRSCAADRNGGTRLRSA